MIVSRLKLTNFRVIETAELRFQRGMNLIVGVNGVGKTSVLEALGVCLAGIVKRTNQIRGRVKPLSAEDVRVGCNAAVIECDVRLDDRHVTYKVRRLSLSGSTSRARWVGKLGEPGLIRESGTPLAVLFLTNRAITRVDVPHKADVGEAFSNALSGRVLRLGEMAAWFRAQEALRTLAVVKCSLPRRESGEMT